MSGKNHLLFQCDNQCRRFRFTDWHILGRWSKLIVPFSGIEGKDHHINQIAYKIDILYHASRLVISGAWHLRIDIQQIQKQ